MHVHSRGSKVWSLPVLRGQTGRRRTAIVAVALLLVAPLLLGAGAGAAAMNAVGLGLAALMVRRLVARKRPRRKEGVWKPCLRCGW